MPDDANSTTEANVEQTKATPPNDARQLSKLEVSKNDAGKWEACVSYRNEDGESIRGETKTFDDFSQASAWVAGTEVEMKNNENVIS